MICRTLLFFVKQKTAYEVHISDWSSDVCSSDLHRIGAGSAGFHCTATSVMPEAMRAEPAMIPNAPVAMACALSALVGTAAASRSEEHTSELQSLMRISYAVFCLKKKKKNTHIYKYIYITYRKKENTLIVFKHNIITKI